MAGVQGRDGWGARQESSQVKLVPLKISQPWKDIGSPSWCLLLQLKHMDACASTGLGSPPCWECGRGVLYKPHSI